jgi:hypothetical protein
LSNCHINQELTSFNWISNGVCGSHDKETIFTHMREITSESNLANMIASDWQPGQEIQLLNPTPFRTHLNGILYVLMINPKTLLD